MISSLLRRIGRGRGRGRGEPPPDFEGESPSDSGRPSRSRGRRRGRGRRGLLSRRNIILAIAGMVIGSVLITSVCMFTGGSSDDDLILTFDNEPAGDAPLEGGDADLIVEVADDGAGSVAEQVSATVEAVLALQSTPELSATLQAQMAGSRPVIGDAGPLNPLLSDEERSPYLSPADRFYLSGHGAYFLSLTQVWVHIRSILFRQPETWDYRWLAGEVAFMQELLDELTLHDQDLASLSSGGVSPVALEYIGLVREARAGLGGAALDLERSMRVFEDSRASFGLECGGDEGGAAPEILPGPFDLSFRDLCLDERERIWDLYSFAGGASREVYRVMSSYGCSICGELYRTSGQAAGASP